MSGLVRPEPIQQSSRLPVFSLGLVDMAVGSAPDFAAFKLEEIFDPLSGQSRSLLEFEIHPQVSSKTGPRDSYFRLRVSGSRPGHPDNKFF